MRPGGSLAWLPALLIAMPVEAGWWQTEAQQAQSLLDQGDAAAAAAVFSDPRRKAYAELKAGDYQAAAEHLAPFDDAESHYNRGNALARAGDLQGALAAYEAALAQDADHADARHNRDLVEQAMQSQQPPSQQQQGGDGESQSGDSPPSSAGAQQDGEGQPGQAQDAPGTQAAQDGEAGPDQTASAQEEGAAGADDRAQAQQDAEAALQNAPSSEAAPEAQQQAAMAGESGGAGEPGDEAPVALPGDAPSEEQLAQEQWLRRIPDDPGGLLRRKFLIEHMMRQQQQQQP